MAASPAVGSRAAQKAPRQVRRQPARGKPSQPAAKGWCHPAVGKDRAMTGKAVTALAMPLTARGRDVGQWCLGCTHPQYDAAVIGQDDEIRDPVTATRAGPAMMA